MLCCTSQSRDAFELVQGEDRHWILTVKQRARSVPQPLTGYKIYMTLRARIESPGVIFSKRNVLAGGSDSQIFIRNQIGVDIGKADIFVVSADSNTVVPNTYIMDLWVVTNLNEHRPLIISKLFKILPTITHF